MNKKNSIFQTFQFDFYSIQNKSPLSTNQSEQNNLLALLLSSWQEVQTRQEQKYK